jgi:Mrp family chromosome partitioning ATPase
MNLPEAKMPVISLFNNKGGVGKAAFLSHAAHVLAESGRKVPIVDWDILGNFHAFDLSRALALDSFAGTPFFTSTGHPWDTPMCQTTAGFCLIPHALAAPDNNYNFLKE